MGQSGTGGDMKTMIAITTIGTVMGALLFEVKSQTISLRKTTTIPQSIMNSAFEDDLRTLSGLRGQNQNILITPQEPINVPNLSNSECQPSLNLHLRKWEKLKKRFWNQRIAIARAF